MRHSMHFWRLCGLNGSLAATLGAAVWMGSLPAVGQEKKDEKPPVLPPTKVEPLPSPPITPMTPGTPFPSTGLGDPFANDSPPFGEGTPLSAGGVFGVPSVTGYRAGSAVSGTKVDVPLIDYPGNISVIPQDLIRDQQALRIEDLLRDIPGAVKLGDFRRDSFAIRGFEIRSRDNRWNGFLDPSPVSRDMSNVERIEILRGPASVLYGSGQPAGLVNYITKKPLGNAFTNVNFQVGSFDLYRTTIDSTGPIDQDGKILYRINAAYENTDSFRDFGFGERSFVAPVFTFLLDENTSITFEGSYLNDRRRLDSGLIAINGQLPLPINRSLNEPSDFQRFNDYKTGIFLTHRFDEDWTGRIGGFANWHDSPAYGTVPIPGGAFLPPQVGGPLPPFIPLRQTQNTADFREQYYSIIADLNGVTEIAGFKNNLLFGTELGHFRATDFRAQLSDPLLSFAAINAFNPIYGTVNNPPLPGSVDADVIQDRVGIYFQDLIDITERWKILAGVRYDVVNTDYSASLNSTFGGRPALGFPETQSDQTDYQLSPRVGVVYQPIPETLSFYGAYTRSFDPPISGIFANPTVLRPEIGNSFEGGVKLDLIQNRLSLVGAGYYIEKDNVVTQDSFLFATQVGTIRSRGAELSAIGQLTDRWMIVANYAYTDSRITDDPNPVFVGKQFRNIPYNTANIWTRYNVIQNETHTLGIGGGIVYVGQRAGDLANTFDLPDYTRFDAGVFYNRGRLNANVYLENLFDRRYYSSSVDSFSIFPGTPFTARAQVGVTF